ncbi:hypothetical protein EV1_031675 [Malus domestica]
MVPPLFLREGKSLPCRLAQSFSSDRENRRAEITRGVVENELETGDGIVSLKNGWKQKASLHAVVFNLTSPEIH